jgi:hypothetical protein
MCILFQAVNQTYKENLMKVKNFVMVKFLRDTMVDPKDTEVNHCCNPLRQTDFNSYFSVVWILSSRPSQINVYSARVRFIQTGNSLIVQKLLPNSCHPNPEQILFFDVQVFFPPFSG